MPIFTYTISNFDHITLIDATAVMFSASIFAYCIYKNTFSSESIDNTETKPLMDSNSDISNLEINEVEPKFELTAKSNSDTGNDDDITLVENKDRNYGTMSERIEKMEASFGEDSFTVSPKVFSGSSEDESDKESVISDISSTKPYFESNPKQMTDSRLSFASDDGFALVEIPNEDINTKIKDNGFGPVTRI